MDRFDFVCEALYVPVTDALARTVFDIVVYHLGDAAELALDGLRLPDQHFQHAVLGPLRQREVVTADLRRGVEPAVDAPVALLYPAGLPRQVEVEQVGAVRLGDLAPRAASLVIRIRSGSSAGSELERRRISLRFAPAVWPWMISIRSSARSVPAIGASPP